MDTLTPLEVIDQAARRWGLEFDPKVARGVADYVASHYGDGEPALVLERLGAGLGVRATELEGSLSEAMGSIGPSDLVAFAIEGGPDGADRGWLVVASRRAKPELLLSDGSSRAASARQLKKRLGLNGHRSRISYMLLQPLVPCDAMGSHSGAMPHGGGGHANGHHGGAHGGHGSIGPVRRLWHLLRPEWSDINTVVIYAIGIGLLTLAIPLTIEALINSVVLNQLQQQLLVLSLILLGCMLLAAVFRAIQTYVVEVIQRRLFVRMASDLATRLPRVRIEEFDHQHGPELVNRFFDILTVQKVTSLLLLDGTSVVLQSVLGMALLAFYNPYLLGFDIVVLASMTFVLYQFGRGAIRTSIAESRAKYEVAAALEEIVRTPVVHKLHRGADYAWLRADGLTRRYLNARREHFHVLMRQIIFALLLQAVATAALLGLGGWLVINNQLTPGQLVAAELIVATVLGSFAKLGKHLEGWYDLMAAVDKLGHLIDLPLERSDGEFLEPVPAAARIELSDLEFSYDGHHEVLDGINLSVAPGERLAIVGPAGSGKSTIADLITGMRDPSGGVVRIDGMALRDLSLSHLRDQICLVRGIDIVTGTVLENVRVGRTSIPLGAVYDALGAVGLREELTALPNGLHTVLGHAGAPLSFGQLRRLMIARAIAGRPRVVVLDEVINGIDPHYRPRVLDALFGEEARWTLVVITLLPEVAQRCDRIVVLEHGKIKEVSPDETSRPQVAAPRV